MTTSELDDLLTSFRSLRPEQFEWGVDPVLYELVESLTKLAPPAQAVAVMFETMERLGDVDLGSPGPLVHKIEELGNYEAALKESLGRRPTALACWMVNRILNATEQPEVIAMWLDILRGVQQHPMATKDARDDADGFLRFQAEQWKL